MTLLDRYILGLWWRTFALTAFGFPVVAVLVNLTDNMSKLMDRGLPMRDIALGYLYALPENVFLVLPAAVLFATVFTIGSLARHSELTAALSCGLPFRRVVLPIWLAAAGTVVLAFYVGELAPVATARQLRLHHERESQVGNQRYNFVYRAEQGWVYVVRGLDVGTRTLRDVLLERQGTGASYPSLVVTAREATYDTVHNRWRLVAGHTRAIANADTQATFGFAALRLKAMRESPADLLAEPKAPDEMRFAELGRYIEALKRSGNDAAKLETERWLKLAMPVTCLVTALFAAPLAVSGPRSGMAWGVAISLGTTVTFLLLAQIAKAVGDGGVVSPAAAAWFPNALFLAAALVLLKRART